MVINSLPRFWRQDPTTLPRPVPGKPRPPLRKRALFDLAEIQACIQNGELDESAVSVVTEDCDSDLEDLGWEYADLLTFMLELEPYSVGGKHDYSKSEWCKGSAGDWYPCDSYAMNFDPVGMRLSASGPSIYVKFSVPEDGDCLLITVSAHD